MKKKDLISVIVPVYKVEKYLEKCINSILSQTYKNLEIFLVDDGSPDNCGKMCDEYAKKDNRIKVIHKQNGGLSAARNTALDVCTGDYITFVDSDDWVEPNYVEELYNALKKYNCDLSVCGLKRWFEDMTLESIVDYKDRQQVFYDKDFYDLFFCKNEIKHHAWSKMYKKDIFKSLRYPVGRNYEDTYIITDICANIKTGAVIVQKPLYNYLVMRAGAITQVVSKKKFDWIYASRKNVDNTPKNTYANRIAAIGLFYIYENLYKYMKKDKELKKELLKLFDEDWKKYRRFLPFKTKVRFFIFKHFKWIYSTFLQKS